MRPETLLAFEHAWSHHDGRKDLTIRRELGITPARFYQLLHRTAHTAEGIAADPIIARRVRGRSAGRVSSLPHVCPTPPTRNEEAPPGFRS